LGLYTGWPKSKPLKHIIIKLYKKIVITAKFFIKLDYKMSKRYDSRLARKRVRATGVNFANIVACR